MLGSCQEPATPEPATLDEECAVYSVVIQSRFVEKGIERIVVADHTLMGLPPVMMGMTEFGASQEMKKIRDVAIKDTVEDYEQKNKSSVPLEKKIPLKVPLVFISEDERDRIFLTSKGGKEIGNPKGFEEFYRRYPKSPGFITLSRVGFNHAKTQALLYIGHLCGGLCGSGQFFLLVKERNSWKIQYAATTWVS